MTRRFNLGGQFRRELEEILDGIRQRLDTLAEDSVLEGGFPSGEESAEQVVGGTLAGGSTNVIPGHPSMVCHPGLLVFCSGRDSLERRLRQAVDHVGNRCLGKNRWVLILTDKWRPTDWLHFKPLFQALSKASYIEVYRVMLDDPNSTPIELV